MYSDNYSFVVYNMQIHYFKIKDLWVLLLNEPDSLDSLDSIANPCCTNGMGWVELLTGAPAGSCTPMY